MTAARLRLGVDFGTSTTIAMLQRADGRVQPLLFDGSPLLSSAVLLGPDGQLHTGRDAAHLARSAPERLEPNPKRRIDDTSVLLGDAEIGVRDLVVAVLNRVAREAGRVAGPVRDVALTHPANWGQGRRGLLVEAARQAGFVNVELVGEPTAAATYFAHTRGGALPPGACVLVYDLGAGTCDVTLLRRTHAGFEQVASDGLNDVGGLDVDAAVIGFLQATYGELWTTPAARRQLWDDVRSAKEMLSRASGTVVMVPALGREVPLGREQLEGLARPVLRSTISMTRALVAESGVGTAAIAGLFLVGGSSRIPLVATLLHEALGIAPVVAEQPELVVAEGSLYVNRTPAAGPAPAAAPVSSAPYPNTQGFAPASVSPPVSAAIGYPSAPVSSPISAPLPSPVSPAAYAPVSPPGYRPAPVSPPGYGPPPVFPPRPAPAPAPQRSRRLPVLLIVLLVVVGLPLLGGGGLLAFRALNTKTPQAGPSASAAGQAPVTTGGPGRYALEKLPEDECAKVDASAFNDIYEAESGKPSSQRSPNATVNTSSCTITRTHPSNTPAEVRSGSVMVMASAYNDVSLAVAGQRQETETAKLAGPNSPVPGLGEEAVVYETPGTADTDKTQIRITLTVRDSNFRMTVYFTGFRNDGAGFSQREKNELRDKLITAAKASFPKNVGGMGR